MSGEVCGQPVRFAGMLRRQWAGAARIVPACGPFGLSACAGMMRGARARHGACAPTRGVAMGLHLFGAFPKWQADLHQCCAFAGWQAGALEGIQLLRMSSN
jgi:hypothetical protein